MHGGWVIEDGAVGVVSSYAGGNLHCCYLANIHFSS